VPSRLAGAVLRRHLARLPSPGDAGTEGASSELELFLPVGPRDLEVASLAVASIRRHLTNRITRARAATPGTRVAPLRALLPDVEIVAEEDCLPAELRRAIAAAAPPGRAGWLTQQFLGLLHVATAARGPCLVWDADTLMVRRQTLLDGTVAALPISLEHHRPYFDLIRRLVPTLPLPHWSSTVAHHMLMEPPLLRRLLAEVEGHAAAGPWWSVILGHVDRREQSCMGDYELYGQWVRHRHPDRVRLVGFRNLALSRRRFSRARVEALVRSRRLDSVSLHWWLPG
jgi:hypothetical protein